jgi:Xaa-Pro aminopeptidase
MQDTNYKERRFKVLSKLKDGVAILYSASLKVRSNDTEFSFRQNSNFKYLTGIEEHDCILVLTPHNDKKTHLFLRDKDAFEEMWQGRRLGVELVRDAYDFDSVADIKDFDNYISDLLKGHSEVFMDIFGETEHLLKIRKHIKGLNPKGRLKVLTPNAFRNVNPIIEQLRLIKDQNEILYMKKAAESANRAHRAGMAFCQVGKNEHEVSSLIEFIFKMSGAKNISYEMIVAGGNNGNILHYTANNDVLNDNEMVLIDAGGEANLYASDVTRTFPVNGKFNQTQKEVYDIVLRANKAAINACAPGKTIPEIHNISIREITQGLLDLNVLTGDLEENIKNNTFKEFYPHGCSHWLGMDVND